MQLLAKQHLYKSCFFRTAATSDITTILFTSFNVHVRAIKDSKDSLNGWMHVAGRIEGKLYRVNGCLVSVLVVLIMLNM